MTFGRIMNSKPVYQQIREDLLLHYEKTGDTQLPSERELCKRYGVCRPTVHKALSYLVENDLIVRRPGKGSFFRNREESGREAASQVKLIIRRDWKSWSADRYFGLIVQGICAALNEHGLNLTIVQFHDKILMDLLPEGASSSIWLSPEEPEIEVIKTLADAGRQVTVVNRLLRYPGINVISGDHVQDGERAGRFALESGYTDLVLFLQEAESELAKSRAAGIANLREEHLSLTKIPLPVGNIEDHMRLAAAAIQHDAMILLNSVILLEPALHIFRSSPHRILLFADSTECRIHGINAMVMPVFEVGHLAGQAAATGNSPAKRLLPGKLYPHSLFQPSPLHKAEQPIGM